MVDVQLNWLSCLHILILAGGLIDRLHDSSVTIDRYGKDVYRNSFFPHITRLWNSMPIECFFSTATWLPQSQCLAILERGQPHSPNVNHYVSTILTQRSPTDS